LGKKVLRFENKEVLNNLTEVLKKIKKEFNSNPIPMVIGTLEKGL